MKLPGVRPGTIRSPHSAHRSISTAGGRPLVTSPSFVARRQGYARRPDSGAGLDGDHVRVVSCPESPSPGRRTRPSTHRSHRGGQSSRASRVRIVRRAAGPGSPAASGSPPGICKGVLGGARPGTLGGTMTEHGAATNPPPERFQTRPARTRVGPIPSGPPHGHVEAEPPNGGLGWPTPSARNPGSRAGGANTTPGVARLAAGEGACRRRRAAQHPRGEERSRGHRTPLAW